MNFLLSFVFDPFINTKISIIVPRLIGYEIGHIAFRKQCINDLTMNGDNAMHQEIFFLSKLYILYGQFKFKKK